MSQNAKAPERPTDRRATAGGPEAGKTAIVQEATVIANLPNGMFKVRLSDGRQVTAHAAQSTRMAFVRLVAGDVVAIELSPFDPHRARIVRMLRRDRARQRPENPFPDSQREEP